jgi:glycosyltransferase involved in cell wall biosynthesis
VLFRSGSVFRVLYVLAQKKFDWFILAESSYSKVMKSNRYEIIYNYPLLKQIEIPREKKWKYGMVYVGSITVDRGIWNMLSVFQEVQKTLPDASLHLIGPIDEAGLELEIKEWISKNSFSDKVSLHGRLPNQQIFDILAHNSIGLCLLNKTDFFRESLPTKMFEYMMAGLPVAITDCSLWKDIIEENKCGIAVDPEKHKESAECIICLLNDDTRLKEFGSNGLKAIQKKVNWASEEVKLLGVYSHLLT